MFPKFKFKANLETLGNKMVINKILKLLSHKIKMKIVGSQYAKLDYVDAGFFSVNVTVKKLIYSI